MTLRLASDPIEIAHGGNAVRLRPSLRAAYLLQRKHGIGHLVAGLQSPRLDIIYAVINATADDPSAARALIDKQITDRGAFSLYTLVEPLVQLLTDCFGVDPDQEHPAERNERVTGKPFDMGKALADLYEIGTGYLEWSPADTWSATPAEIIAAQRGLFAKLRAIHGGADDQNKPAFDPREEVSDEEVQIGLTKLRANAMRGRAA